MIDLNKPTFQPRTIDADHRLRLTEVSKPAEPESSDAPEPKSKPIEESVRPFAYRAPVGLDTDSDNRHPLRRRSDTYPKGN
jgi:hypothetical protein